MPVKKACEVEKEGVINIQKLEDIQTEPLDLPPGFRWVEVDLTDEDQLDEVYEFLKNNYVEDKDAMFRFDY